MYYVVKEEGVTLKKNFYSAMQKDIIVCQTMILEDAKRYVDGLKDGNKKVVPKAIFGDDVDEECVVCLYDAREIVFSPCGHFITCESCSRTCKKCPLCASAVMCTLTRDEIKD
ncbi:hypothetical protein YASMINEVIRUS_1241 [Yasminevirus sp. GU-2018]|uniref:RING-type domain-containing protein n=1 Tax=Yasminevirus sp. GU-2018 TaxID=2420051 RepID=A0A5K0U9F4_9VIRU|nr:hypothetical protein YASMINEVIRUS_1241 [Yasminevirus sp. GU-2018]